MKQRYDTVNEKLWNLETRMDTMSRDQAENSCAIQSKLDALLRNITAQDCNGHRGRGSKTIMKGGTSNTTNAREDSSTNTNVAPDAMTWAST